MISTRPKYLAAAGNFERVAGLQAVVGADRDFDQLAAGLAFDLADDAFDGRHHGTRVGVRIDAVLVHHGRHCQRPAW